MTGTLEEAFKRRVAEGQLNSIVWSEYASIWSEIDRMNGERETATDPKTIADVYAASTPSPDALQVAVEALERILNRPMNGLMASNEAREALSRIRTMGDKG